MEKGRSRGRVYCLRVRQRVSRVFRIEGPARACVTCRVFVACRRVRACAARVLCVKMCNELEAEAVSSVAGCRCRVCRVSCDERLCRTGEGLSLASRT
jgi:hypothetical protein